MCTFLSLDVGRGTIVRIDDHIGRVKLHDKEFASRARGDTARRHLAKVGVGSFDNIATFVAGGFSSTMVRKGGTEEEKFHGTRSLTYWNPDRRSRL